MGQTDCYFAVSLSLLLKKEVVMLQSGEHEKRPEKKRKL